MYVDHTVARRLTRVAVAAVEWRTSLETNGCEISFGCPAEGNYQKHHAFLLGHGEDNMMEVLSTLGCKLVGWNAEAKQITVFFSGDSLAEFFKKLDKEDERISNKKVVTTQQVRASALVARARAMRRFSRSGSCALDRHTLDSPHSVFRQALDCGCGGRGKR